MDQSALSRPRNAKNGDKPGAYHLASHINSNVVDPGSSFDFDQYITGYGEISSAKLRCYISGDVFEYGEKSFLKHGLQKVGGQLKFGRDKISLENSGFVCHIAGRHFPGDVTSFFDIGADGLPEVITEVVRAPFSYSLLIKKNVKPGDYKIDVYFTYYNGEKWQCSKETVSFRIRNFFERNSGFLSSLGMVVAIIAIFRGIADLMGNKFELHLCKWVSKILSDFFI